MNGIWWVVFAGLFVVGWVLVAMMRRSRKSAAQKAAYEAALAALAEDPRNSSLRVEALAAGRLYYSGLRTDGTLTIYDEQAINNDINARSAH